MLGAWTGAVLGDNIGYLIGRRLGRAIVLRYGAKIGINDDASTGWKRFLSDMAL